MDIFESLVRDERERQDEKWGEQNWVAFQWLTILAEEFGELAKAINEAPSGLASKLTDQDKSPVRKELVQVAAVCKVMFESGKRNGWV